MLEVGVEGGCVGSVWHRWWDGPLEDLRGGGG